MWFLSTLLKNSGLAQGIKLVSEWGDWPHFFWEKYPALRNILIFEKQALFCRFEYA